MTIDELLARESIRHLIASYNIAGDSVRAEALAAVFSDDAIYEFSAFGPLPAFRYEGSAAIRDSIAGWQGSGKPAVTPGRLTFLRHHITTCQIDLSGPDSAKARTYWMVYTDIGPDHCGTYNDQFRCVDGQWLIAHRKIRLDWRSPQSLFPPID